MPHAYLPSCFTLLFTVVSSGVADSQSPEEGSAPSLWSGWHVTAKSVTAARVWGTEHRGMLKSGKMYPSSSGTYVQLYT